MREKQPHWWHGGEQSRHGNTRLIRKLVWFVAAFLQHM